MSASQTTLAADLGPVRQLGYIVEDLDAAVSAWQDTLGLGPWTLMRDITLQCRMAGADSRPQIDIALAYRGALQIELIQQRNTEASPYRADIEVGRYGLHHSAFLSERIDEDVARLQAAGLELVCDIRMPMSGRYVYFASPVPGDQTYLELLEATAMMKQMFAKGMADAVGWQGEGRPLEISLAWPLKLAGALSAGWSRLTSPFQR